MSKQSKQRGGKADEKEPPKRNLNGSLDQLTEELRDAYMTFKELQDRCVFKIEETLPEGKTVVYHKPETFLLEDPEKQRQYRDQLIKKIINIPKPDNKVFLGDELHRQMLQTINDYSTPQLTRQTLSQFYKHKLYTLQHKRYKLLNRWCHLALTQEVAESMGHNATLVYSKLQMEIESTDNRFQRLQGEDDYDKGLDSNGRPTTKAKEGGSLYVERKDMLPQSVIRQDDIDVYLRTVSFQNKVNKQINKYLSKIKWVSMTKKYDIFQTAVSKYFELKDSNIKRQEQLVDKVTKRAYETNNVTEPFKAELNQLVQNYHIKKYRIKNYDKVEACLNSHETNHDIVPDLISNQVELKIKILEESNLYGLKGNIELDNGFSFSYQITVFFPQYFQKQVVKSQFSIYDMFADEIKDKNLIQKQDLQKLTKVDTNILRDISSNQNNVPSDNAFSEELKDHNIKVIRLKSSKHWIDYVTVLPSFTEHQQRQAALLNANNPIDTLLKQAMEFLDVNDLQSISRIVEETSRTHSESQKDLSKVERKNVKKIQTIDGEFIVDDDQVQEKNLKNESNNINELFSRALNGKCYQKQRDPKSKMPAATKVSLNYLPHHLLSSYYTLRYIRSRDLKTKILYCLNYFRGIQKRLMIDLREFGTRERVVGDTLKSQSYDAPQENQRTLFSDINKFDDKNDTQQKLSKLMQDRSAAASPKTKTSRRDFDTLPEHLVKDQQSLIDMKKFKYQGQFSNKIYSTCPIFPKYHSAYGEPVEKQPLNIEMQRIYEDKGITDESLKLIGRIDNVEICESSQEVFLQDDFGIYIMYDCALQDMQDLETELLKYGSYYIAKQEINLDIEKTKPFPSKDRMTVVQDLMEKELDFQFNKVLLIQNYIECYEHVTDPLEQHKLVQTITDLMSTRPRLDLGAAYFRDSYDAESQCIQKHTELIKQIIQTQQEREFEENMKLQNQLDLSYYLANQYENKKWQYADAEKFFEVLRDRYNVLHGNLVRNTMLNEEDEKKERLKQDMLGGFKSYDEIDDQEFAKVLGLPEITVETLFKEHSEKDDFINAIMNEQTNFNKVNEGYPEFFTTAQASKDKNNIALFKMSPWSKEVSILDFYESLSFASKLYASIQSAVQDLYESLKPHSSVLMTLIEDQIMQTCINEYHELQDQMSGIRQEYTGSQYIEDESIIGCANKMQFYTKEMYYEIEQAGNDHKNPYLIAQLDLSSMQFYHFDEKKIQENKYKQKREQFTRDKNYYINMAQDLIVKQEKNNKTHLTHSYTVQEKKQKIVAPLMLETGCNTIELARIRYELIMAITEVQYLRKTYEKQCQLVGRPGVKYQMSEGISLDQNVIENDQLNYIDHGPGHALNIDLGINEFDATLRSNLNFRDPDSFKILINTQGLEEMRAILHYQMMQKQLLIIACTHNQLILDSHMRAFIELNLVKEGHSLPNMVINVSKCLSKTNIEGLNQAGIQKQKTRFSTNLSSFASQMVYVTNARKSRQRTNITKQFFNFSAQCQKVYHQHECSLKQLRVYKLMLLNSYCQDIMYEAYYDAMKIQVVQICQRLRTYSHYFQFEPETLGIATHGPPIKKEENTGLFDFETIEFIENVFDSYNPQSRKVEIQTSIYDREEKKEEVKDVKVLNIAHDKGEIGIVNYMGIPSSLNVILMDAASVQELKKEQSKLNGFKFTLNPESRLLEMLKRQLLKFKINTDPIQSSSTKDKEEEFEYEVDFEGNYKYENTKYASMLNYYRALEKVMTLEFFILKLQFNLGDILEMDHAVNTGIQFWSNDQLNQKLDTISNQKNELDKQSQRSLNTANESGKKQNSSENGEKQEKQNPLQEKSKIAEKLLNELVKRKQNKLDIAEELLTLKEKVKMIVKKTQKGTMEESSKYLIAYSDLKYNQILATLMKLMDQFHLKGATKEVVAINDIINKLVQRDHIKLTFQSNSFHCNQAFTSHEKFSLETRQMLSSMSAFNNQDTEYEFNSCIQPMLNEKALEPAQITLLESIYLGNPKDLKRNYSQFAGQLNSRSSHCNFLRVLDTSLINFSQGDRTYIFQNLKQQDQALIDYMDYYKGEKMSKEEQECPAMDQILKGTKYFADLIQSRQLKVALMCWQANSTIPLDSKVYQYYSARYKKDFLWKIIDQKEEIMRNQEKQTIVKETRKQLRTQQSSIQEDIHKLQSNNQLTSKEQEQERDKQVKDLESNFQKLQMKVIIDSVIQIKAEIKVLNYEIQANVVRSSIKTLDAETAALSNAYNLSVEKLTCHIHPFQQFASTLFDVCDDNAHLDLINKVSEVQRFLTKLRNRGTIVETLTSGPGIVFTVKDINECLQVLCRGLIKDSETAMRTRSEELCRRSQHWSNQIHYKELKIKSLESRLENQALNIDKIINSRLYEKGSQLIYELDLANRQLRIFKDQVFVLEKKTMQHIRDDFAKKFRHQMIVSNKNVKKFEDMQRILTDQVKADLAEEQEKIKKEITAKGQQMKNLPEDSSTGKKEIGGMNFYGTKKQSNPKGINSKYIMQDPMKQALPPARVVKINNGRSSHVTSMDSSQMENHHKVQDYIFPPNSEELMKDPPRVRDIYALSENEARLELSQISETMRKQKMFFKVKEMLMIDKYEKEIMALKKKLSSNATLWEQLAESEKREQVLKQEKDYIMQSLTSSQKVIDQLKEQMKELDNERTRLLNYKTTKQQRLNELESKVKQFEVLGNVDVQKLIDILGKQETKIKGLENLEKNFDIKLSNMENRKNEDLKLMTSKYVSENIHKREAQEKMEQMRFELKMLEKNDGSVANIWKTKCKELFDICSNQRQEIDTLKDKYRYLQEQSQMLVENLKDIETNNTFVNNTASLSKEPANESSLPNLMSNQSIQKLQNSKSKPNSKHHHVRYNSINKYNGSQNTGLEDTSASKGQSGAAMTAFSKSLVGNWNANGSYQTRGQSLFELNSKQTTKFGDKSQMVQQTNLATPNTRFRKRGVDAHPITTNQNIFSMDQQMMVDGPSSLMGHNNYVQGGVGNTTQKLSELSQNFLISGNKVSKNSGANMMSQATSAVAQTSLQDKHGQNNTNA